MSRAQLAPRAPDLPASVAFCRKLFGTEPTKLRNSYANFAIADPLLKLALIQGTPDEDTPLDHLAIEVDTPEAVHATTTRLPDQDLATDIENDTSCCYTLQDRIWVHGPGREPREAYVVKADTDSLTKQKSSTCYADPTVIGAEPTAPVEAGGCCP
ncbi:ArsI/CadI family heavy metal resistance metalloenzyme [Streptomyces sp. NPDC059913]|uniref:ArsI/CadI family heavy metal resistance metalloenzyme n=1 Tax=unclassified Streptomyces TaxID=2593676 RepID=UPI003664D64A